MVSATYILRLRPWRRNTRALHTDMRWMTALTSVYSDPDWVFGADTQIPNAQFELDNDNGLVWLLPLSTYELDDSERSNKLTLVAGFTAGSAPEDLIAAAAFAVKHLLGRSRTAGNQRTAAGETITPADADMLLPRASKEALSNYVRWSARVSGGS